MTIEPAAHTKSDVRLVVVGAVTVMAIVIGMAVMSIGNGQQSAPAPPQKTTGDVLIEHEVYVESAVKARLRDPDSAVFRHLANGCGYVNSRNGFGGMTGFEPFMVDSQQRAFFEADSPRRFVKVWKQGC